MTYREIAAPVVVGINGSWADRDALDWAAAEAAARDSALRIVHASPLTVPCHPWDDGDEEAGEGARGERVLRDAMRRARLVAPDARVTTHLAHTRVIAALLGQRTELIVVGGYPPSKIRSMLTGLTTPQVCARATCPVVVVHPLRATPPGPSATRVIVGLDSREPPGDVLHFAFLAAEQRGVGLTAVYWPPQAARPSSKPGTVAAAGARVALSTTLAAWRRRFPTVDLLPKLLVRGAPGQALAQESAGAALVVIASRGSGLLTRTRLGPASQAALRQACCPIAVIPRGQPAVIEAPQFA